MVHKTATKELADIIAHAMMEAASSKTRKYFIREVTEKCLININEKTSREEIEANTILRGPFIDRIEDVVETIEAIRGTDASSIIVGKGDVYSVSEYQIPTVLVNYTNSGKIYASTDAIGREEPYFQAERKIAKLSPLQFNKVFDDFNENQHDGYRIAVVENWDRKKTSLEDVQYLEDGEGSMLKLHEQGFDIYTCDLIGLQIDGLSSFLTRYDAPTVKGYEEWLLS